MNVKALVQTAITVLIIVAIASRVPALRQLVFDSA